MCCSRALDNVRFVGGVTPVDGRNFQSDLGPPDPQIIVQGLPRPPNNGPGARRDHFGSFWEKSGKSAKSRPNPIQIPQFFTSFFTPWLDLVAARRSGSKKAARGCPRIQIWSHEGPNQSQNHGFAHPANRKARAASGLEPRHVLRKQAIFFFFQQKHAPWKNGMLN